MEGLTLSHTLIDHFENKLLDGSPIDHKSLKDIPLLGKITIMKGLLLSMDLRGVFEK